MNWHTWALIAVIAYVAMEPIVRTMIRMAKGEHHGWKRHGNDKDAIQSDRGE